MLYKISQKREHCLVFCSCHVVVVVVLAVGYDGSISDTNSSRNSCIVTGCSCLVEDRFLVTLVLLPRHCYGHSKTAQNYVCYSEI